MTSIDIVIVNWNSGQLLARAVTSIQDARPNAASINLVVVDNNSTDESLDLAALAHSGAQIIVNSTNRGFAAACNQGADLGSGEFILLMNPDVELAADSLAKPLEFLQSDRQRRYAICGIGLLDADGRPTGSCSRFPTPARYMTWVLGLDRVFPLRFPPHLMNATELLVRRSVDQVIGAFFLVRRGVFEELGGLDERFFMYFEEVDFSYRAMKKGYASFYLPDVHATHRGGGSSDAIPALRLRYSWESRVRYALKHFSKLGTLSILLGVLLLEPLTRLVQSLVTGAPKKALDTVRASAMLWIRMPCILARPQASPPRTLGISRASKGNA